MRQEAREKFNQQIVALRNPTQLKLLFTVTMRYYQLIIEILDPSLFNIGQDIVCKEQIIHVLIAQWSLVPLKANNLVIIHLIP